MKLDSNFCKRKFSLSRCSYNFLRDILIEFLTVFSNISCIIRISSIYFALFFHQFSRSYEVTTGMTVNQFFFTPGHSCHADKTCKRKTV